MSIFNKSFDDININDVNSLITNEVTEGQNLEFKREVWGRTDGEKREMLRDISSMANKYGGFLIVGMEEDATSGKAIALCNIPNAEEERDRIWTSCLANLRPRITGLNIKVLEHSENNILLCHIPNSYQAPHQIMFQGKNEFWIRHDRQKSRMTVDEVKDIFFNNYSRIEKISDFLQKRKDKFISEIRSPMYVLQAYPVGSNDSFIDITDTVLRNKLKTSPGSRRGGWCFDFTRSDPRPSYNGLAVNLSGFKNIELFRNGYLEGRAFITSPTFVGEPFNTEERTNIRIMGCYPIIEYLLSFVKQVKQIKEHIGYEGSYLLGVSFINIKDHGLRKLRPDDIMFDFDLEVWEERHLIIEPIVFENINPNSITKFIADRIWQSFKYEQEPLSEDGKFNFN
jgi:hypothetical protein